MVLIRKISAKLMIIPINTPPNTFRAINTMGGYPVWKKGNSFKSKAIITLKNVKAIKAITQLVISNLRILM